MFSVPSTFSVRGYFKNLAENYFFKMLIYNVSNCDPVKPIHIELIEYRESFSRVMSLVNNMLSNSSITIKEFETF
jgi:hypothetical protein